MITKTEALSILNLKREDDLSSFELQNNHLFLVIDNRIKESAKNGNARLSIHVDKDKNIDMIVKVLRKYGYNPNYIIGPETYTLYIDLI